MSGLHHVELYVSNLSQTRDFWDPLLGLLGYRMYQEWQEGVSWISNGCYLVFVQTQERFRDIAYHRCGTGLNHLAFKADSREHVDTIRQTLRDQQVSLLYDDRFPRAGGPESYAVFFEDPDRIKVEIVYDALCS